MVELFVQRLEVIEYPPGGSSSVEHQYLDPAWSHIEQAIRALDKHRFPFLNLCGTREWSDDDYMTVMGGAGAYWLSVTSGEHDQRRLFDVDRGNADVLLWTSDQGFSQPECFTTDRLEDVLLAANTFYECGDCAADLIWE